MMHGERRGALASIGAFLVAFLASSHHTLHMALISVGIGASSFLFTPGLRRGMLAMSLVMTGLAAWWVLRRPARSFATTLGIVASTAASLALIGYSVVTHGW